MLRAAKNVTRQHTHFFFCGRSAVLRPSVHMLPGTGWCGAGLPWFPTACWWLTHPAAITGVNVTTRWDSPGGCGGLYVPLLCNHRVQKPWCQFASGALAGHTHTNEVLYAALPRILTTTGERRLRFSSHCWRSKNVADLVLWEPKHCQRNVGGQGSHIK